MSYLCHFAFVGAVFLLARKNREKKFFAASLLLAVFIQAGSFFCSLCCCLGLFYLHTFRHISQPFLSDQTNNLIIYSQLAVNALLLWGLRRRLKPVFDGKPPKWYLTAAMPPLFTTAVIDVVNLGASHGILLRGNDTMGFYYDQIFSHANICVLTALSLSATGISIRGMHRIYLEQEKSSQYHAQIASYQMLEEQYRLARRLRHDLKNHILALRGLLENKEWEKMQTYLKDMEDSAGFGDKEETTGNRVVDILLSQKQKLAQQKQIQWECAVQIPGSCGINEFDLCVLFGNLLDNALEACEKICQDNRLPDLQPFIKIQGQMVKNCFLLEIKNSTAAAAAYASQATDREYPAKRGIGLLNVRDMISKYNGTMTIDVQNHVYDISVLIPLNNTVHDNSGVI